MPHPVIHRGNFERAEPSVTRITDSAELSAAAEGYICESKLGPLRNVSLISRFACPLMRPYML